MQHNIKVKGYSYPEEVIVNIVEDGYCHHMSTRIVRENYDIVSSHGQDITVDYDCEICNHCGCYRSYPEGEWSGINILPIGYFIEEQTDVE